MSLSLCLLAECFVLRMIVVLNDFLEKSEMLRALDADNQGTSTFISPQTFYGDGVMS